MGTLIVDSYIEITARLKDIISEMDTGMEIYTATSYEQALQIIENFQIKTIILDINLPKNQSFELVNKVKIISRDIIVIALGIHIDNEVKKKCTYVGADYLFDKYSEFDKIGAVINIKKAV